MIERATSGDAAGLQKLLSDPRVTGPSHLLISPTLAASQFLIQSRHPLAIRRRTAPEKIIGLLFLTATGANQWELGYLLQVADWNRGLMTEALTGVVNRLKVGTVLEATVDRTNPASARVLEKIGFQQTTADARQTTWRYQKRLASEKD
ncbi:GNAT family N-acetyltransferase [Limosilactobacillus sp.]|uniref:GNAT family N-acetyltransferase n=1 Tax=Limosilactobacillus sp. TaxID=2773925 RepID=UPI0025BC53E3|nr:GNAT family N-acetyltransferase [Limosilactobacillus sp.]MCH3921284.1 GNAT family N-acetyltransferase [Limosilactobacillus sp.]MCH3928055.1 GNAT family N-acetyltransferase [Limosilactobacillus sp.]